MQKLILLFISIYGFNASCEIHKEDIEMFKYFYISEVGNSIKQISPTQLINVIERLKMTKGGLGHIWTAGNGGSATIASHLAHNLTWDATREYDSDDKISASCFNDHASEITARANDLNYCYVFSSLLQDKAKNGDVLIVISGSGESDNIIKALKQAKLMGISSIAIAKKGSSATNIADLPIEIDSKDQQILEDTAHILMHMIVRSLNVGIGNKDASFLLKDIACLKMKCALNIKAESEIGSPKK